MKKLKLIFKLFLLFMLILASIEVRLRLFSPSPFIVRGQKVILPANKRYVFVNNDAKRLDKVVYVTKNSLGFRGEEPPSDINERFFIIVVGGSSAASDNLTDGKTWVDGLSRRFARDLPNVWINNAGFPGHSTVAHLMLMEDYIVKLKPRMVIFLAAINDIDVEAHRGFDEGIVKGKFQVHSVIDFLRSVNRNVETVNFVVNMFLKYHGAKRAFSYGEMDLQATERLVLSPDQKRERLRDYPKENLAAFRARIRKLADLCIMNGIRPVFVTVPALFGDGIDPETGVEVGDLKVSAERNGSLMGSLLDLYNKEVLGLRAQGVTILDLAGRVPKTTRFFSDYYHFTNEGAEEVSRLLYPGIKQIVIDMQEKGKRS